MKIGIQTWGTYGDIQPFAALAGGLAAAGHDVTLAYSMVAHDSHKLLTEEAGFKAISVSDHFKVTPEMEQHFLDKVLTRWNMMTQLKIIFDAFLEPVRDEMYIAAKDLCMQNDIVIGHFCVYPLAIAAEQHKVPRLAVALNHSALPSRHITPPGAPPLGEWLNPLWWRIGRMLLDQAVGPPINRFRRQQGLSPVKNIMERVWCSKELTLVAVSPSLCKRQPDWDESIQVCGFLDLPEAHGTWQMPEELKLFFDHGEPPVFLSFGSMMPISPDNQKKAIELMTKAVKLAGCRAIIQSSVPELANRNPHEDIFFINRAPHSRIFPFCSAVVHHGGAGTTHSALAAGCPSIVVAHVSDQMFWGNELTRLGVGPKILHRRSLTAEKLADRIRTTLNSRPMRQKAQALGQSMRKEDGVGLAVRLIEHRFSRPAQPLTSDRSPGYRR